MIDGLDAARQARSARCRDQCRNRCGYGANCSMYYVYWEDNGIMAGLCIKIKVSNTQPIMEQVKSKCAGLIVIPPWYINNAVIIKYKKIPSHAQCIQLPRARIEVETREILLCVLRILLRFHSHVENRTVSRGANHLTVQTALTTLALCP